MDDAEHHLPPIAEQRIRRQRQSRVAGSLLSAPAAAALAAADLEPAGEVMGCIVMHLGWAGYGCGGFGGGYGAPPGVYGFGTSNRTYVPTPILTSGGGSSWQGFGPYVQALYHAYDSAQGRMLAEAGALGADGVVGVSLTWSHLDSGARELMALGTAVRFRTRPSADARDQPAQPFCTELNAEEVASAMLAGWQPVAIVTGLCVAVKHDDWPMQRQTSAAGFRTGNVEVTGLTALVQRTRADARERLTHRAAAIVRRGQVVISAADLDIRHRECRSGGEGHDHVAEARFVGTVLRHHGRTSAARPPSLSILPLRGERR